VAHLQKEGSKSATFPEGVPISPTTPYAELWMGTHPNGPSKIGDMLLQTYLIENPHCLGAGGPYSVDSALPFLLKVLSVGKALSVQAHPDRTLAQTLHASRPDLYKDDNHKPEMAVALTPFEAMCSFRAPQDMATRLHATPELRKLAGEKDTDTLLSAATSGSQQDFETALRVWYTALMNAPRERVEACSSELGTRLSIRKNGVTGGLEGDVEGEGCGYSLLSPDWVAYRLLQQYPGDVGVFAPYILNCIRLHPGSSLFLGANEPHAYLAGDCVEIMATSDNVVRAGLTPKFKDVPTLVSMLSYKASGANGLTITSPPTRVSEVHTVEHTIEYSSPVPEFRILVTRVVGDSAGGAKDAKVFSLCAVNGPSILLVTKGAGAVSWTDPRGGSGSADLQEGAVWFISAELSVSLKASATGIEVFRALPNTI